MALQTQIYPLGERALVLDPSPLEPLSWELQAKLCWLATELRLDNRLLEVIPGMNNLTLVVKEPGQLKSVKAKLDELWQRAPDTAFEPQTVTLQVSYGGEFGPDLIKVAQYHDITPEEVVHLHTLASYKVFFIGFQPGFAYLEGLPHALHTPRLATPRLKIPAGSVGIGGEQTGVYPLASPGGWQLIGQTQTPLFDPLSDIPCLLAPGDIVRFQAKEICL